MKNININVKDADCNTRKYLGLFLEEARKEKNWTREEFASKCEEKGFSISEDTIKSYEIGNRIPPLPKLICLLYIMDYSDTTSKGGSNSNFQNFNTVCQSILNSI